MIKEVKYGGFSANPNDHEALEGDLAVAMNLIPEDGTVRPVLPPTAIAPVPGDPYLPPNDKGRKVFCIHKTAVYEHYIVGIKHKPVSSRPPYWHLYQWDGTESGTLERLGMVAFNEIYKVEPVGNTLVVLADNGVHYILWDINTGAYRYLGQKPPRIDITFSLSSKFAAYPGFNRGDTPLDPIYFQGEYYSASEKRSIPVFNSTTYDDLLPPKSKILDHLTGQTVNIKHRRELVGL